MLLKSFQFRISCCITRKRTWQRKELDNEIFLMKLHCVLLITLEPLTVIYIALVVEFNQNTMNFSTNLSYFTTE